MKNLRSSATEQFWKTLVPATYPTNPVSGDPCMYGTEPCVATADKYTTGDLTGYTPVAFGPVVAALTVNAVDDAGNSAVVAGDVLYYTPGDAIPVSKKASGFIFGKAFADDTVGNTRSGQLIAAGSSGTIRVKIASGKEAVDPVRTQYATVSLTNAQVKALRATPITLVAAQGANKIIEFVSAQLLLVAGTNALTETTANLAVKYTDGSGAQVSQTIEMTGFIDQTVNTTTNALPKIDVIAASSASLNKPLVLHNLGAGEFGGNAANDATLKVFVAYRVKTIN